MTIFIHIAVACTHRANRSAEEVGELAWQSLAALWQVFAGASPRPSAFN
jgi:hypothetical protein